eukprot:499198_1
MLETKSLQLLMQFCCALWLLMLVIITTAEQYSVSGGSSGSCFVTQHSVAYSSDIIGVAVLFGAPYMCMSDPNCQKNPSQINITHLQDITKQFASEGLIDNWHNIQPQNCYGYSGTKDTVVPTAMAQKSVDYYSAFGSKTLFKSDIPSEHAMITNFYGNPCNALESPYIDNCNFDLAGALLQFIHGKLLPPMNNSLVPYSNLIVIDQSQFVPKGKTTHSISMDNIAFVYIGSNCIIHPLKNGCRLHVTYHGCLQGAHYINDTLARNGGFNGWGETNNFVILYPQVIPNAAIGNPEGCWDWWGYSGKNYAWKNASQLQTVTNMIDYILND